MILVFTSGVGLSGAVTRWWTWGDVGHVAVELGNGMVPHTYLDATPTLGVAEHPLLPGTIVGRYEVLCSTRQALVATQWLASQIGKPYDWEAIWGMPWRRDWRSPDCWFCADLIARACEVAEFPLLRADQIDRITPRDLMLSEGLRPALSFAQAARS